MAMRDARTVFKIYRGAFNEITATTRLYLQVSLSTLQLALAAYAWGSDNECICTCVFANYPVEGFVLQG